MKVLIFCLLTFFSVSVFASKPDTTRFANPMFQKNLENLLKLSYVKKAKQSHKSNPAIVSFSPEEYRAAIGSIPTIIPMTYNPKVQEFIDFYTRENRVAVEAMLGVSQKHFPMFEKILVDHKLPPELKYLPAVESGLYPFATSEEGASGVWQLKYPLARIYGLTISTYVDERRSPEKSTYAAAEYLKQMYNVYNDWLLVIAAYNCGPGNVNKAIHRAGEKRDFWAIYDYLPSKTR